MVQSLPTLGLGIGWRPPIALAIERRTDLGFVELVAEHFPPSRPIPPALQQLGDRGIRIIPHGISLSLGGAEPVDENRVRALADLARRVDAPLVSEHIAFVRAGGIEAGHLLPIPRTRASLDNLINNVRTAQQLLPVPLALENISTLFDWPGAEIDEAEFVNEALDRTGCLMLLDIANVWANAKNLGGDPIALLRRLPLDRIAYVHVGGGIEKEGVYHDTHAHSVPAGVLELLGELSSLARLPGVMLERDDNYPPDDQLMAELEAIAAAAGFAAAPRGATACLKTPSASSPRSSSA